MATQQISRMLRPSILSPPSNYGWVCAACRRHASSQRRTRKMLRIGPASAFEPSRTETEDHIIFNPPSSAPNVYHTPMKFLPKDDPRRKLHSLSSSNSAQPIPSSSSPPTTSIGKKGAAAALPRPVRPPYEKKYHLKQEQIDEIRRLRAEDPRLWTRVRLAEKFECSQFFVSLCCSAPEIKEERDRELEAIKSKWGRRKREAREDRQIRKAQWGKEV